MKQTLLFAALLATHSFSADIQVEKLGSVLHFSSSGKTICDYQMEAGEVPEGRYVVFKHSTHLNTMLYPSRTTAPVDHPQE